MNKLYKWLIGGAITAGTGFGIFALLRYKKASTKLQIIPQISIDAIGLTWVRFRIIPTVKNPSAKAFKFEFPHISVYHNSTLLGSTDLTDNSSTGGNAIIELKPAAQITLGPPNFPLLTVRVNAGQMGDLLPLITNWFINGVKPEKGAATLRVVTITNVVVAGQIVPTESEQIIDLAQ